MLPRPPQETASAEVPSRQLLGRAPRSAAFRFAVPPRFGLEWLTCDVAGRERWLHLGGATNMTAGVLRRHGQIFANTNVPRGTRTADQRLHCESGKMETTYDARGGNFADAPHPGGVEQSF